MGPSISSPCSTHSVVLLSAVKGIASSISLEKGFPAACLRCSLFLSIRISSVFWVSCSSLQLVTSDGSYEYPWYGSGVVMCDTPPDLIPLMLSFVWWNCALWRILCKTSFLAVSLVRSGGKCLVICVSLSWVHSVYASFSSCLLTLFAFLRWVATFLGCDHSSWLVIVFSLVASWLSFFPWSTSLS